MVSLQYGHLFPTDFNVVNKHFKQKTFLQQFVIVGLSKGSVQIKQHSSLMELIFSLMESNFVLHLAILLDILIFLCSCASISAGIKLLTYSNSCSKLCNSLLILSVNTLTIFSSVSTSQFNFVIASFMLPELIN
ncbi:putative ORFan [Cotonvirus japonicus]|uniref:ORFan n=1 Tax=Cotonvirus japonicus TaxID=2811091 RepID=A0ABM7NTB8_9VIRU|nr:putative ORFan [Cotonvirus japonicus]BCS83403.1 putative ORFan [Cotonvirus japonicus]